MNEDFVQNLIKGLTEEQLLFLTTELLERAATESNPIETPKGSDAIAETDTDLSAIAGKEVPRGFYLNRDGILIPVETDDITLRPRKNRKRAKNGGEWIFPNPKGVNKK